MKRSTALAVLAGSLFVGVSSASASITFAFADPTPGTQFTNVANGGGPGVGQLTWDTSATIAFNVDGSLEGIGSTTFTNARMEANFNLGIGAVLPGGTIQIPATGTFTIYDFTGNVRTNILTGTGAGALVQIGSTSISFSTATGFAYTAGPALLAWLPVGSAISPLDEAVFTLTGIVVNGGASLLNPDGVVNSFVANSSFSGNTQLVPAPAAMAMLGLGGLVAARRRRA